eukprot:COSAG06_NODE_5600_length_3369_cov_71.800306_2_plen_276_part_00
MCRAFALALAAAALAPSSALGRQPAAPASAKPPNGALAGSCSAGIPPEGVPADVSHPTSVVGTGDPTTCTFESLTAAVTKGGIVTFDCGPDPITLFVQQTLKPPMSNGYLPDAKPFHTVVDGGGLVTAAVRDSKVHVVGSPVPTTEVGCDTSAGTPSGGIPAEHEPASAPLGGLALAGAAGCLPRAELGASAAAASASANARHIWWLPTVQLRMRLPRPGDRPFSACAWQFHDVDASSSSSGPGLGGSSGPPPAWPCRLQGEGLQSEASILGVLS